MRSCLGLFMLTRHGRTEIARNGLGGKQEAAYQWGPGWWG